MIGRKAETVLNRAVRYAVEHEHEYFTLEHVLWSLLAEASIVETVRVCGGDAPVLRKELEAYLVTEIPKAPKPTGASSADLERRKSGGDGSAEHPVATLSIQRLIQRALFQVQSAGKEEIQPIDLFVALFQAKDSQALHLLARQGIERLDVLSYVSHGEVKDTESARGDGAPGEEGNEGGEGEESGFIPPGFKPGQKRGGAKSAVAAGEDPLSLYALNLNERARLGKIDPLVGRQNELDRMIQTLCRRRKNNPLLVGEAGVGKTALAEGLALRVVEKKVPDLLKDAVVYALDLGALLAGAKFRGDFEQRLKKVFQALERKKNSGQLPVLLIDEIHTIIGAGAVSGGALDAANLLKPVLAQGEIRCIGSTTYSEYRSVFEKDHALARRFQKIDVAEPTVEEAVQILSGLKQKFEEHHGITYTSEALRAAVELSSKHITERFLPDKAIDVIDEAGAKARLKRGATAAAIADAEDKDTEDKDTEDKKGADAPSVFVDESIIDQNFIEEIIAQIARIPARSVSTSQKARLKSLERDLKLSIFGQDHAIDALVVAIRLARSGLRSGDKPVGSFLFCGPTGVGKTELSKQLAHCLGVPFLRFDMSEYGEKHTVSRLIGAPPGYVGFEQAGLLTDAMLKTPHAVVLLDEIEKAHYDIWNILLQVMDHGSLTDNNGRKADFRHAIIIMTSNVGSRELERRGLGLAPGEATGASAQKAVENTFSPEFRNRLDQVVYFNPLDPLTVGQVVGKQLVELESQLLAKHVELDVGADAREWLAHKGYDRKMGARPMARLIQEKIKKPLAEEILFGRLEHGGEVHVHVRTPKDGGESELHFDISAKTDGGGHETAHVSAAADSENHRD